MTVSSSIGPASGIDYGKLLDGLLKVEQVPVDRLKARLEKLDKQNAAYVGLSTLLTGLKLSAVSFSTAAIFRAATAASSNTSILNATAGIGTPVGSYQLTVQRLASASQVASQGFASTTAPAGLSGDLTFGFGKGNLDPAVRLADLNGGKGVSRGSIRITDRTGAAAVVDLSKSVDMNDVVDAINTATGVNVKASIDGDRLVLADRSGGIGNFTVADVGNTTTATDLGLAQSVASGTLTGTDVNKLSLTSSLNALNNGNGVRTAAFVDDFSITGSAGSKNISLTGAKTLGDVIAKINAESAATGVTAGVSADGHGLTLTDADGTTTPAIAALNGSNAARDLGLTSGAAAGGTLTGVRINGGLASALLRELRGGQGVTLGTIRIANRAGGTADVDLSGAQTVEDVLKSINGANAGVTASLNSAGTGIQITDATGAATNPLAITDVSGTAAAELNLAQSVNATSIKTNDLHLRSISDNTALSTLNGGSGFKAGKMRLTDSTGASFVVDLSGPTISTVGDVLKQINQNGTGIKASINANGDGILLTDSSGGTLTAKVEEVDGGTTAKSLNLLGNFAGATLNGSQRKTVTIGVNDTLNEIAKKINDAGVGASAQIINDGSDTPFRLSLVSRNSGASGNLLLDGDAVGITGTTLVRGQDAVVSYGNGASTIQATSATNALSTLVPSMTINLAGVGTASITVSRDDTRIKDSIKDFVEKYNKVLEAIAEATKFNQENPKDRGALFGDGTVQEIQQAMGTFLTKVYPGVGPLRTLSAAGITVEQDGKLKLNDEKLSSALANNPDDLRSLFTSNTKAVQADPTATPPVAGSPEVIGIGETLNRLLDRFINGQTGLIFKTTDSLASQTRQLNNRVTALNELIGQKKTRLIRQFANLEVSISKLQSQSTALSSYKGATASAK